MVFTLFEELTVLGLLLSSVADPGCFSRIQILSSPDSEVKKALDPDQQHRMDSIFNPKIVIKKLSEI
jgi:hypothetical protein